MKFLEDMRSSPECRNGDGMLRRLKLQDSVGRLMRDQGMLKKAEEMSAERALPAKTVGTV